MRLLILSFIFFSLTAFGQSEFHEYVFNGGDEEGKKQAQKLDRYMFGYGMKGYPKKSDEQYRLIVLENTLIKYGLWLPGRIRAGRFHSPIGMYFPSAANFYANGFLKIRAGDFDSTSAPFEIKNGNGSVSFSWRVPPFSCDAIFTLPEDSDMLLLKISLSDSSGKMKAYKVSLLCYPGSTAGGFENGLGLRNREIMTPKRTLSKKETYGLTKEESWVLFYDRYFDYANNLGEGPCAFIFNPLKVLKAEVQLSDYACRSFLTYPAGTDAEIILREFYHMTNDSAVRDMKALEIKLKD